jgi:hypothetical protein
VGAVVLAVFATSLSAWIGLGVFDGIPHITDGVAYSFQARIFASGRLYLQPPPVPEAFAVGNINLTASRWSPAHTPGWPVILTLGYLLHAPWLVDPVMLGLAVFGLFVLGRILYDDRTGLLGALLLAISPFALVLGATFLSHVPALCVTIWALAALAQGRKTDEAGPLLLAGLLAGFAPAVRPYTAAAVLFPAGVWLIWKASPRTALRRAALVAAGAFLPLLLFAGFNAAVWGHPLRTGYAIAVPSLDPSGSWEIFGLRYFGEHFPRFFLDLNREIWAEPWPDLLPLVLLLPRRNRRAGDGLLLACSLSLVLAHSVFRDYVVLHSGPRYALEAVGPLSLLVARAFVSGGTLLGDGIRRLRAPAVLRAAVLVALAGLLIYFPLGRRLPKLMGINSRSYGGQTLEPLRRTGAADVGPDALVLVSGNWVDPIYSGLSILNELDPTKGRRVYALDYRHRRDDLDAAYPRAQLWKLYVGIGPWPSDGRLDWQSYEIRRVVWTRVR